MDESLNQKKSVDESLWFVLARDSHEGPYRWEQLLKEGQHTKAHLFWKKGLAKPITWDQFLTHEPRVLTPEKKPEQASTELPPFVVSTVSSEEAKTISSISKPRNSRLKSLLKISTLGLSPFLLVVAVWNLRYPQLEFTAAVAPKVKEQMLKAYREQSEQKAYEFSPLWSFVSEQKALVGLSYEWRVCRYTLDFKSQANENLSASPVRFMGLAQLKESILSLKAWKFAEGSKIYPGHYQLSLKKLDCESLNLWQKLKALLWNLETEVLRTDLPTQRITLSLGHPAELEDKLAIIKKKLAIKEQQRLALEKRLQEDVYQKKALLEQTQEQLLQLLRQPLKGKQKISAQGLSRIQNEYQKNWGSLLTRLVDQSDEEFSKLAQLKMFSDAQADKLYLKSYTQMREFAKKLGAESATFFAAKPQNKKTYEELLLKLEGQLQDAQKNLILSLESSIHSP
jgi:hypothetical protein